MAFDHYLMLHVVGKINGERTLPGMIHLLKGRPSLQAVQDSFLFGLSSLYHACDGVDRRRFADLVADCLKKGWITPLADAADKFRLSHAGRRKLSEWNEHYRLPSGLRLIDAVRAEGDFWLHLQLLVQTLSELNAGNDSFLPVTRRPAVTERIRQLVMHFNAELSTAAENLHDELRDLLICMPSVEADLLALQLSGHKLPGLTPAQLPQATGRDFFECVLLTKSALRRMIRQITENTARFSILAPLMPRGTSLSRSAAKSFSLLRNGLSIDKVSDIRGLSRGTIEDHIVEIVLKVADIDVSRFLPPATERLIRSAASRLGTRQLKPIKASLGDRIDYFQIRLALARSVHEGNETNEHR